MYRNLLAGILLLATSVSANAMEIIPRLGVDLIIQRYSNFDNKSTPLRRENSSGIHTGIIFVSNDTFFDISVESANHITPVNNINIYSKGWRSEIALSGGYRVNKHIWITGGYQMYSYGKNILGTERGNVKSPFIGFSITNLQQGNYAFSISPAFMFSPSLSGIDTSTSDGASDGIAGGIKINLRKKGSPHMWSARHRLSTTGESMGFQDIVTKFSYSYLFL